MSAARVNLERAAALNSRLGGHLVQGHVDGTGHVISRSPSENWTVVRIALPDVHLPIRRGEGIDHRRRSLADGLRARVGDRGYEYFEISLIPTTLELTTLGTAVVGTPVNLEVDVIAKYVERLHLPVVGQADRTRPIGRRVVSASVGCTCCIR